MKKKDLFVLLFFVIFFLVVSCAEMHRLQQTVTEKPVTKETVWTEPIAIYTSVPDAAGQPVSNPSVAVDHKGAVDVVWWARGFGEVYFSRSTDGGKSFSKAVNISNTPLGSDHPAIAVDSSGAINVVWDDSSLVPFRPEILFTRSTDEGATWSAPKNISNTPTTSSSRSNIAVDPKGAISVVWIDGGRVLFTRSTDGGLTWLEPKSVSEQHPPNGLFPPALVIDTGGRTYIAWSVPNSLSYITRSTDGGATFTSPLPISAGQPTLNPNLAVDRAGTLYAVWSDGSSGILQVVFAWSKDRGETFSPPVNISRSGRILSLEPRIAVDPNGMIWMAWTQIFSSGLPQVFMSSSAGVANDFSQPVNLSFTSGNGWLSNLAAGPAGDVDVVWEKSVKEAIFFSKITQPTIPVRAP